MNHKKYEINWIKDGQNFPGYCTSPSKQVLICSEPRSFYLRSEIENFSMLMEKM